MKFLNIIFQSKFYLVILILIICYFLFFAPNGFNHTISWGRLNKLNHFTKLYFPIILIFYFLGYGILSLLRTNTNKILSITQMILICGTMILIKQKNDEFLLPFSILSICSFLANTIFSLYKKMTTKKN